MLRRMDGSRLVALVLAVVLAAAVVTWLATRDSGADETAAGSSGLPSCADLAGTDLGPLDEDPAWNGCVTEGGAAVRSYRYECSGLRELLAPRGERLVADEAAVAFLPDAGLMAATGQPWVGSRMAGSAYLRTPLTMLVQYRCDELRSLPPQDGVLTVGCDLDDVALDLVTTQGCSRDGEFFPAVGRLCGYPDGDTSVPWEQWSIAVPGVGGPGDTTVLESGPDEQWWMVPGEFRDQRCGTPPDQWEDAWR